MCAVLDNKHSALSWSQPAEIRVTLLRRNDLNVRLRMVDVRNHRDDTRNGAVLRDRFRDEDRDPRVAGKVARTADAVHHVRAGYMRRVDVAVNVEFERSVHR